MSLVSRPNYNALWSGLLIIGAYVLVMLTGPDLMAYGIALILVGLAVVLLVDWFLDKVTNRQERILEAGQEDYKIVTMLLRMPPDVLESLQASRIVRQHVLGWGEVKHRWIFTRGLHEVEEFETPDVLAVWQVCTPELFAPVSTWGDETIRRRCAQVMVQRFVDYGWLRPPAGNQPATWVGDGYQKAKKALWE